MWLDFVCEAKKGSHDDPSVAVVSANHGISDNAGFEVVVIFPSEIESCRKRVVDVASGAKNTTDDHFVGTDTPALCLTSGEPIACGFGNGFA